jgi:hypothetical protein
LPQSSTFSRGSNASGGGIQPAARGSTSALRRRRRNHPHRDRGCRPIRSGGPGAEGAGQARRGLGRSRSGPHGSDAGSTPAAEASAGRARGTPRLCGDVVGFTVDLWEEGRAHPTWDHHGGVSPRARWVRQTGWAPALLGGT